MAEKTQLEQKLKLQRVELQKLMSLTQAAEDKARAELHDVQVREDLRNSASQESLTECDGMCKCCSMC